MNRRSFLKLVGVGSALFLVPVSSFGDPIVNDILWESEWVPDRICYAHSLSCSAGEGRLIVAVYSDDEKLPEGIKADMIKQLMESL